MLCQQPQDNSLMSIKELKKRARRMEIVHLIWLLRTVKKKNKKTTWNWRNKNRLIPYFKCRALDHRTWQKSSTARNKSDMREEEVIWKTNLSKMKILSSDPELAIVTLWSHIWLNSWPIMAHRFSIIRKVDKQSTHKPLLCKLKADNQKKLSEGNLKAIKRLSKK